MKKTMIKMAVTGAMAGLMATTAWAGNMGANQPYGQGSGMTAYVMTLPAGELSEAEAATLLHMREEEKLARDVYTTLYNTWDHWAFERISNGEQRHMDAVLALMEKYDVADPVADDATGTFADTDMADLYEHMVETGTQSLANALRMGATIEDLDIADLLDAIDEADDEDLVAVYQNLLKGSRNHLRSFVYQLGVLGETYTPQYISTEAFTAIVASPRERGLVDADGSPVVTGGGQGRRSRGKGSFEDLSVILPIDHTPLLARGGNGGQGSKDGSGNGRKSGTCINTDAASAGTDMLLARGGNGGGRRGPGDGTGNGGQGPKDGSGNGRKRGTCINTDAASAGADMLLARGGDGGGGHGPGNGSGNGGDGPGDGTGNGSPAGDCSSV